MLRPSYESGTGCALALIGLKFALDNLEECMIEKKCPGRAPRTPEPPGDPCEPLWPDDAVPFPCNPKRTCEDEVLPIPASFPEME